jgi:hypothetical protein
MLILRSVGALVFAMLLSFSVAPLLGQTVKRTTTKTDKFDFGAGGTVTIAGAPTGSIKVVGSSKNEIEISAEIELEAANEADLATLSQVTSYIIQESVGRVGVITASTYNKLGDKKLWKKFPKNLVGLPFRIDYTVSVPRYCDLQIDGGKGDLTVSGVEGSIRINYIESRANLALIGGGLTATFGTGTVDISMPDRSWRGNALDVRLGTGALSVHLPANLSAELDASVLKTGKIENVFTDFKPRTRTVPFTEQSIIARAGSGGVSMKFTVGDGTLKLLRISKPN